MLYTTSGMGRRSKMSFTHIFILIFVGCEMYIVGVVCLFLLRILFFSIRHVNIYKNVDVLPT